MKPHAWCLRVGLIHDDCSLKDCYWGVCRNCKRQTLGDELGDDRLCPPCLADKIERKWLRKERKSGVVYSIRR